MAANFKFLSGFTTGTITAVVTFSVYRLKGSQDASAATKDQRQRRQSLDDADPHLERKLRAAEILKYGPPDRGPDVRFYANHVLGYDRARKIPLWVAEHITKSDIEGSAHRKGCNFVTDPNLDPLFASQNSDYKRSGWSRGHMAPAGNNKFSQIAMDETFYLSNIVPQDINSNAGFWNRLEIYSRELTERYRDVRVTSGPLMLPSMSENGKSYVQYEVIGRNVVSVPTHLFKVIETENPYDSSLPNILIGAFVVPNKPLPGDEQLQAYQVPLETLEKYCGLKFLPQLNRGHAKDLCEVDGCQLISQEALELRFTSRKLVEAQTLHRLETVWSEYLRKNPVINQSLNNLYQQKKEQLAKSAKPPGG